MRLYSEYPFASITMSRDEHFIKSLGLLFKEFKPKTILESGTFVGLGSTDLLAKTILQNNIPIEQFFTLEVDYNLFRVAKKNLKKFSFIKPIWGMSVSRKEARVFIENDNAIKEHEKYPEIFIDDINNPFAFYKNEIDGHLSASKNLVSFSDRLFYTLSKPLFTFKENVFEEILPIIKNNLPLILLDSAGGIGLLEFNKVFKGLTGTEYLLILDDVYHLKHFRSREIIEKDPNFNILFSSRQHGWLIAYHKK